MDNSTVLIFKSITNFVSDLNIVFGSKYKSIALYNRLLEKTGLSKSGPIMKHIECFRKFFSLNREGMESKNCAMFNETRISYSDNCYVDMKNVFKDVPDDNTSTIIWKHLLTIWGLIDPNSQAKKLLQSSFLESGNNTDEVNFLSNIIDKVESSVSSGNIDASNPMAAVTNLMQSGVFTELISDMHSGMSSGKLNIERMIGGISTMIGKMNPGGDMPPEISGLMSMMSALPTRSPVKIEELPPDEDTKRE